LARSTYDFARGTFHFFVVFGRRPVSVLWLALWQMLAYVALAALVLTAFWPLFDVIASAEQAGREATDAEILAVLGSIWLAVSASLVGAVMISLMVQGAWLRLLTHGRTAPVIPFRLGLDELRLFGVNALFVVFVLVGHLVSALVIGLAIGVSILGVESEAAAAALGGGLTVILMIVFFLIAVFLMLRFAAAPAMSVNESRFRLFGSFAATRDIWGWMLLSYLVLYVLILVAASLVSSIQIGAVLIGAADIIPAIETMGDEPNLEALLEILRSPFVLIALGITIGLQILLQIVIEGSWHGVGAYAALRHTGDAGDGESVTAPAASVGDAPKEG